MTLRGVEVSGAHNSSHNGAAIRISGGRHCTVEEFDIHNNDMGVMSNGRLGDPHSAEEQRFERCHVHHNGDSTDPGMNHNLYLGGTSATLRFGEIDHATTGHNVKSRAHLTRLEYCWIHDSSNRELDFVEGWDTEREGPDAILVGCVVKKNPSCTGNRGTIHFGMERRRRVGTLRLANCTLVSPFSTPVIALDGGLRAEAVNCRFQAVATGPIARREDASHPGYRWAGGGRWVPAIDPFLGAG